MQRLIFRILGKEFAIQSHRNNSFVLVTPFSADQAKQSSSQKAYQPQLRPTFPDGNVLTGTLKQVNYVI